MSDKPPSRRAVGDYLAALTDDEFEQLKKETRDLFTPSTGHTEIRVTEEQGRDIRPPEPDRFALTDQERETFLAQMNAKEPISNPNPRISARARIQRRRRGLL